MGGVKDTLDVKVKFVKIEGMTYEAKAFNHFILTLKC